MCFDKLIQYCFFKTQTLLDKPIRAPKQYSRNQAAEEDGTLAKETLTSDAVSLSEDL
jgi:hypothetical protein